MRTLARRHGINPKTVAKWQKRESTADRRTGPTVPRSTVLSVEQEAIIVSFRKHTHDQLKAHLTDFLRAYNFARRLKTLKGLTPYEYLCKLWTQTPDRFTLNPIHQMPGLNT